MMEVPADTPHAVPVLPTVAIPDEPELHVPPAVASVRLVHAPAHTVVTPIIADGKGLTVATIVAVHPVLSV
jgi:hypothetical protein